MKKPKKALLELIVIAAAMLTAGCIPGRPLTLEDQVQRVHKDMRTINKAAHKYIRKHGSLPAASHRLTRDLLIKNGYLKKFPTPPAEIFTSKPMDYHLEPEYDPMDAGDVRDAVLAVWGLKDVFCMEYNRRFASDGSGPTIYDFEANNNRNPGETIGRQMITYAIKWRSADIDDCGIEWVVEYR